MGGHTLLLLQTGVAVETRTYLDFSSSSQCWDAVVRMYEERLKSLTPDVANITYDAQDLFRHLDNLHDISVLVLDESSRSYVPHPRDFIKSEIFAHLKRQAGGGGGGRR